MIVQSYWLDRPEVVSPPQQTGMVLRSHSRAGRSEVIIIRAEIHPERPWVVTKPEPEIEFMPIVGSSSGQTEVETTGSPEIDSSGETFMEVSSDYPFPARHEQEVNTNPFLPSQPAQKARFSRFTTT